MAYDFEKLEELLKTKGVGQEEIKDIISPLRKMAEKRRYGLVWEEQEEDIEKSMKDRYTVLQEVTEREIKLDEGGRTHSLIEGDNLEALTFLKNSGKKVDVIYIDPPYNTTNRDFIYNDDYVDKEDAWRHSKWLSFMNKRLVLARDLLADDGLIFISIDDNELAQLRLLCDQIYGERNYLSIISRIQNKGAKNDSSGFISDKDYILVYAKNCDSAKVEKIVTLNDTSKYNLEDQKGKYKRRVLEMQNSDGNLLKRPNLGYSIYFNPEIKDVRVLFDYDITKEHPYEEENTDLISDGYICFRPKKRKQGYGRWKWGHEKVLKDIDDIDFDIKSKRVYQKERMKETVIQTPRNTLDYINTLGTNDLKSILPNNNFSYPKPVNLIKWIVARHPNKNATVLDFFAGSGTTAHAVLELNKEDNGNRQVILCTNNENNIAEEVTYERIKRVMEGYTTPKGKVVEGIAGNLRYFKVDSVDADEDIYTLEDNLLEVVVPFIQYKEDSWSITKGIPGFTYLDDRVTIYNDPYHLDEDFLDHIRGNVFYIYDGWMDYLDIEELKDIRVVPIPKEFFKDFRQ